MRPGSTQFSVPRENFDHFEPEKKTDPARSLIREVKIPQNLHLPG